MTDDKKVCELNESPILMALGMLSVALVKAMTLFSHK